MSPAAPAYPEFDRAEFEARWERARAGMHARGLDALLVTTEANYRYLSGHATLAFMNRSRPLFCLLPRDGAPLVLAGASESSVARNTSWVADVRAFTALVEPGVAELAQAVRDIARLIEAALQRGRQLLADFREKRQLRRRRRSASNKRAFCRASAAWPANASSLSPCSGR